MMGPGIKQNLTPGGAVSQVVSGGLGLAMIRNGAQVSCASLGRMLEAAHTRKATQHLLVSGYFS